VKLIEEVVLEPEHHLVMAAEAFEGVVPGAEPREAFVVAVVAACGEKAGPLAAPALGAGGDRGSLVEHVGGERHLAGDAGGA
jgi:hypothetical protein